MTIVVTLVILALVIVREGSGDPPLIGPPNHGSGTTTSAGSDAAGSPGRRVTLLRHRLTLEHARYLHARRRLLGDRRLLSALRRRLTRRLPQIIYLVNAFECIHEHEGPWTADTGNGYYGGLQMDENFMRAYAPDLLARKGTAAHWTVPEQMAAAFVGYTARGFQPWPNTARACGLR